MNRVVQTAFRSTIEFLRSEVELMPLSRWNESVLRYYFCRFLAVAYPQVEQLVESDKIDLVLRQPPLVAFIEFKFYRHPRRFDPYDGRPRGFKGGPGPKNLSEFQACIDHLYRRRSVRDLSKYVVLLYADPTDGSRPNLRFSQYYDNYRHPDAHVSICRIACSKPIETADAVIRAQLYKVD